MNSVGDNWQDLQPLGGMEPLPDMDDMQFKQWVEMLEQRTGTTLPPERKSFLITNLGLRMREIGCKSYQEYFDKLNSGVAGLCEWSVFVDRITVHETRFFRHLASLDLVREKIYDMQAESKGQAPSLHVWSTACSTGEEAYTLAMVIEDCIQSSGKPVYYGITATDISSGSILVGRKAIYGERRVSEIDPVLRKEYLVPVGDGRYQVCERLRKRVCFARLNLLDIEHEPVGKMDIIYCQNLLIYFDRELRDKLVSSMVEHLQPKGLLILGSGELLGWTHPLLEKIKCQHTLAYRRKDEKG